MNLVMIIKKNKIIVGIHLKSIGDKIFLNRAIHFYDQLMFINMGILKYTISKDDEIRYLPKEFNEKYYELYLNPGYKKNINSKFDLDIVNTIEKIKKIHKKILKKYKPTLKKELIDEDMELKDLFVEKQRRMDEIEKITQQARVLF